MQINLDHNVGIYLGAGQGDVLGPGPAHTGGRGYDNPDRCIR